jgi:hypothetical protein
MNEFVLHIADIFFVIFHSVIIIFNVFGWIWKKTRKLNLITLFLTGSSWFILGIFYVFGYCPLTDWHFQILRKLNHSDLPSSYIKYLIERVTPYSPGAELVDTTTLVVFFVALFLSVFFNIRDIKKCRAGRRQSFSESG